MVVVSRFLPDPAGPAGSRLLHAFVTGARALDRDVAVWSWWPHERHGPLPDWVRWEPLPAEPAWRVRARALVHPRADVTALGWRVPDDHIALAEDPLSVAAVARHPRSVATLHYLTALDCRALRTLRTRDVQDLRAEHRAARAVAVPTAYSERVARRAGHATRPVPAAIEVPARPVGHGGAAVVACVADWSWPPNRAALARLLDAWPLVRGQLPAARLTLAGRLAGYGDAEHRRPGGAEIERARVTPGVDIQGPVDDSRAVLAGAAALVFPCADTSGPKTKVMEAMSLGLPVVTTPAGLEGLAVSADCAVVTPQPAAPHALATAVVGLLRDPERRAALARRARQELAAAHAPEPAARARLAVIDAALAR